MNEKKFKKLVKKMNELMEKENDMMIRQNEKERKREIGESCFDTANKGSKIYQKELMKN